MNSPSLLHSWSVRLLGESDRYRIEMILSTSNIADVYLATDTKLLRQVAIKLLKESPITSTEMRKRFKRDVACCAALDNEHIVKTIDSGFSSEGFPFYVMEYLKGQTLQQLLKQEKCLSVQRTVAIAKQICSGLQMAYQGVMVASERVKIVHRDLKPANIFLVSTDLGELVKILGFDTLKKVCDYADTPKGTNVGTFYAGPEQLEISQTVDERVDIYCLGFMLYEMLSGANPLGLGANSQPIGEMTWTRADVHQVTMTLQSQPGCEPIPASLIEIVNRCLQKSPSQRYASIQELQSALDDAIATEDALKITKLPLAVLNEEDISSTIFQSFNASAVKSAEESNNTIFQPARSRKLSELGLHEALKINKLPLAALNEEDSSSTILQSSNASAVKSAEESNNTIFQPARSRKLSELGLHDEPTAVQNLPATLTPKTSSSGTAIQPPISRFTETDSTMVQFRGDSRLNLDTTVCQGASRPLPKNSERLTQQSSKVSGQENQNQDVDRGRELFPVLFGPPSRALSSVWVTVRSWMRFPFFIEGSFSSRHPGANSSSLRGHQSGGSAPALDAKSYEDAIKALNECRLSYAKELGRNGKFLAAIATAKSIPETSLLHPQAQRLIDRWKQI